MIKNKVARLLHNSYIFAMITRIGGILLGLVYTILLSRYLGPTLRGEYSVIQNYANLIAAFIGVGICYGYPYSKRRDLNNSKKIYKSYVGNIIALFSVYFIFFIIVAFLVGFSNRIKITLIIVPIIFLYKQLSFLVLIEHPRLANLADLFLCAFDIVFILILTITTEVSYFWCIFFLIGDKIIYASLAIKNTKCNLFKDNRFDKNFVKYISFGFLPMITDLLMTLNYKVDIIMLSLFENITTSDIGIYSVGVMLAEKILLLPDALSNILQSKLAIGKKEEEVVKICRYSVWITSICLIGVAIVGKQFIVFAFGSAYVESYHITMIILFGIIGLVFYKVIYSYNMVMGKKKRNFIPLIISAFINMLLNFFFIRSYGSIGAAYASLLAFIFCGILFLIIFCRNTHISLYRMILPERSDLELIKKLFRIKKKLN